MKSKIKAIEKMPWIRFPEFRDVCEEKKLGNVAELIDERAGENKYILMSVTSGVGLVSQIDKFGREIAGNSSKNYLVIRKWDFAYNKSATKQYPEGYISMLVNQEEAAVPNSIFTCFRIVDKNVLPRFLDYMFHDNLHGKWLRKFIEVGARAHGSLSVDDAILFKMPIAFPTVKEQQKIVDSLTSIDDLISAESQKLDTLKEHKNGLMQNLFPAEGEAVPKLRFPEFGGKWERTTLGEISTIKAGTTPLRSNSRFYDGGDIPWVKTGDLNNSFIYSTEECITSFANARINPEHSILVAMYGGFNQIGRTGYLKVPAATNQAVSVLNAKRENVIPLYLLIWLNANVEEWRKFASSSRKDPNITGADVARFQIAIPSNSEQQKIADCLSTLDELIAAQSQKINALKLHKKGLMQQLFPSINEVNE